MARNSGHQECCTFLTSSALKVVNLREIGGVEKSAADLGNQVEKTSEIIWKTGCGGLQPQHGVGRDQ